MQSSRVFQTFNRIISSAITVFLATLAARSWVLSHLLPEKAGPYFYDYTEPARIAWAIVSGYGFSSPWPNTPLLPTAQQPPLYPFLLAGIFKLFGAYSYTSLWIAVGLNSVFSAVTAVFILKLGKRDFGICGGILAAWVWALWMYESVVSVRLWESSLSALLLAIALWFLPKLAASSRTLPAVLSGLFAGLCALTNTTLLSLFPFFWLWFWMVSRRRGLSHLRQVLISILACLVMLAPWTIRNCKVLGRLIPVRDNFGLELWIGNHEGVTHTYDPDFPVLNPSEYIRLGEVPFMESKRQIAMQFIGRHPGEFFRLSLRRFWKYWTDPEHSAWGFVSILAWTGAVFALRGKRLSAVPYVIVLLIFPVVYYITHTFSGYRHPIEPEILLLAAYSLWTAFQSLGTRLRPALQRAS